MLELNIFVFYLLWIFLLHTIADFVFQTRWMAENKSKNMAALFYHIMEYTFVIFLGITIIMGIKFGLIYSIINGIIHLITDFITSKISSYAYKSNKNKLFWTMIGFDQLIHISSLLITLAILTNIL